MAVLFYFRLLGKPKDEEGACFFASQSRVLAGIHLINCMGRRMEMKSETHDSCSERRCEGCDFRIRKELSKDIIHYATN